MKNPQILWSETISFDEDCLDFVQYVFYSAHVVSYPQRSEAFIGFKYSTKGTLFFIH